MYDHKIMFNTSFCFLFIEKSCFACTCFDSSSILPFPKNGSKNLYQIKCADTFRMLTVAYGEATLDRSNVYRYKMFFEGREDVNDEQRTGSPSTSTTYENIDEVKKIVLVNRRITVREVAEDLDISIGTCHSIFANDLCMTRVAPKFVPKLLNFDQKQLRIFGQKQHTSNAAATVFPRSGAL